MRSLLLNLRSHERRKHAKHFLQSVHCAVRIPAIPNEIPFETEQQLIAEFAKKSFANHSRLVKFKITTASSDGKIPSVSQESTHSGIRFVSSEPRQEVQLSDSTITLSVFDYEGFEKFTELLQWVVELVVSTLDIDSFSIDKVGLRKIDSIIAEEVVSYEDACSIFNPALFGLLRSGLPINGTVKSTEESISLEKDGKYCLMKNKIVQLEKSDKYQADLDFDLIDSGLYTVDQCMGEVLTSLNQLHYDLFMWAVTDVMLNLLDEGE